MSGPLAPGFYDVPAGNVATVVTHLEMTARPVPRPSPDIGSLTFVELEREPDGYRDLFRRVGAEDWLWFSRLRLADVELNEILRDPNVHLYTLSRSGQAEALLELDFRSEGECELAFFGVTPALIGTGAGRFLMNKAIDIAWAQPIHRFHVHTCTLDHPSALNFYRRSGFVPVRQQIEIAHDPRLTGLLPENAGPHIPIFPS